MSAVKTQNQQKLSELSKGCNESFSVFHSIWCDILTGSTLLYAQDILEPPFPYKPPAMQIPFSTHRHTHTPLCGKYPELLLDIYLSSLRFKMLGTWLFQALDKLAELCWRQPCLHLCKVTQDKPTAQRQSKL